MSVYECNLKMEMVLRYKHALSTLSGVTCAVIVIVFPSNVLHNQNEKQRVRSIGYLLTRIMLYTMPKLRQNFGWVFIYVSFFISDVFFSNHLLLFCSHVNDDQC